MPIPSSPSFSTRSAVTRSTLWATYSKPLSAVERLEHVRRLGLRAPRRASRRPCAALDLVRRREDVGRLLGDGERARRGGRGCCRGSRGRSTVATCWLRASALNSPPLTVCSQAARTMTPQEGEREGGEEQPDAPLDQLHASLAPHGVGGAPPRRRRRCGRGRSAVAGVDGGRIGRPGRSPGRAVAVGSVVVAAVDRSAGVTVVERRDRRRGGRMRSQLGRVEISPAASRLAASRGVASAFEVVDRRRGRGVEADPSAARPWRPGRSRVRLAMPAPQDAVVLLELVDLRRGARCSRR